MPGVIEDVISIFCNACFIGLSSSFLECKCTSLMSDLQPGNNIANALILLGIIISNVQNAGNRTQFFNGKLILYPKTN